MTGNSEWDNRMMDSLKNFDLSSPEVKQQFGKFEVKIQLICVGFSIYSGLYFNNIQCYSFPKFES